MRPTWKRLLQIGSAPGWIAVVVVICRGIGQVLNTGSILPAVWNTRLIALWNFLQTPGGSLALAMLALVWLTGFVFWPGRSHETKTSAPAMAFDTHGVRRANSTLHLTLEPAVEVEATAAVEAEAAGEAIFETADTAGPSPESWIAAQGAVVQLIPDHAGCTAVMKSGQDIIHARFDKTWLWYLNSLPEGRTLKIEGNASASRQTDHRLDVFDCVCPDGIRVIQAGISASSPGSAGNGRRSPRQPPRSALRHV